MHVDRLTLDPTHSALCHSVSHVGDIRLPSGHCRLDNPLLDVAFLILYITSIALICALDLQTVYLCPSRGIPDPVRNEYVHIPDRHDDPSSTTTDCRPVQVSQTFGLQFLKGTSHTTSIQNQAAATTHGIETDLHIGPLTRFSVSQSSTSNQISTVAWVVSDQTVGVSEAFKKDTAKTKVNVGVGMSVPQLVRTLLTITTLRSQPSPIHPHYLVSLLLVHPVLSPSFVSSYLQH